MAADTTPAKIAVSGISDAPIEILERILDFLHEDHIALSSSSLVCRNWVSASRYHLFNPTILTELRLRRGIIKENVSSFLALVQAPCSTILPAIRTIVIYVTTPELIKTIVEELRRSKALTQLLFLDTTRHWELASVSWIAQALPNIHDLSYNALDVLGEDACRFIASFPKLQSLAIYTRSRIPITFPIHISGSNFIHLRTLRLKLDEPEKFLLWLQSLDGWHSTLETFDLRMFSSSHIGWGPVNALNSFLKANSGTLKHLSIGIDYVGDLDEDLLNKETQIDLSTLSNLSSLFFRTHDINAICDSISSLNTSSNLEALTVHALRWQLGSILHPDECHCDSLQLLPRLASIMEGNQSFGNTTIDLAVRKNLGSLELESVTKMFGRWKQRDAFELSYADEDDFQLNTEESIRHLVFKRK